MHKGKDFLPTPYMIKVLVGLMERSCTQIFVLIQYSLIILDICRINVRHSWARDAWNGARLNLIERTKTGASSLANAESRPRGAPAHGGQPPPRFSPSVMWGALTSGGSVVRGFVRGFVRFCNYVCSTIIRTWKYVVSIWLVHGGICILYD